MKCIFTIFLVVLSLHVFAQSGSETNTSFIHNLFDAINKHDSVAVADFFDDSAHIESPNWEGIQTGKQAVKTVYSRYFKGTPDIKYSISNIIKTDSAVVVEYSFAGTFSSPEAGTPAYMKGKKYTIKGCTRYNIANGKITNAVSYFDQVSFLRQVGFFDNN